MQLTSAVGELLGMRWSHVLTCKEDSNMNVREVMSRDVKIASPEDTLQHAAELMVDIDAGVLPVGENDRLVGILTDRDITTRAVAKGKAPDRTKVREVMSPEIKYIYEDES